ncbi:hypothetical protein ACJJTC_017762 [Scirpophaga incertulas]
MAVLPEHKRGQEAAGHPTRTGSRTSLSLCPSRAPASLCPSDHIPTEPSCARAPHHCVDLIRVTKVTTAATAQAQGCRTTDRDSELAFYDRNRCARAAPCRPTVNPHFELTL